jgi:tetratricopeptide (TPR) repeat protein
VTADGDPRAMAQEALRLERADRLYEAEAVYQRLLARWPDLPDTWFNLAVLQRKAGRFDAALASYQQALDRGVSQPEEAHLNRGVIYSDCLRREEAAAVELRAALALNPKFVPALLNLANLQEDLGRRDEAVALYERILAIDARCHVALARHASLKTATGPDAPTVERLRAALAQQGVSPADQASLGFALGMALEKAGAYDQAFAVIGEANRQSRLSAGPGGARYDRDQHERFVDALIATFSTAQRPIEPTPSSVRPIFVCGMFRSGSTLIEQVLAGHPRVTAGGEIDFRPRQCARNWRRSRPRCHA